MKESYKKFLISGFINTDLKHPKNFLAGLPKKNRILFNRTRKYWLFNHK